MPRRHLATIAGATLMTNEERMVKKTILLPKAEVERFKKRHQHGDMTWFFRQALAAYNQLNDVDPEELIRLAVKEVRL